MQQCSDWSTNEFRIIPRNFPNMTNDHGLLRPILLLLPVFHIHKTSIFPRIHLIDWNITYIECSNSITWTCDKDWNMKRNIINSFFIQLLLFTFLFKSKSNKKTDDKKKESRRCIFSYSRLKPEFEHGKSKIKIEYKKQHTSLLVFPIAKYTWRKKWRQNKSKNQLK